MLILALSCISKPSVSDTFEDTASRDEDGDGYFSTEDCNDLDPTVHPGEPFTCIWERAPLLYGWTKRSVHRSLHDSTRMGFQIAMSYHKKTCELIYSNLFKQPYKEKHKPLYSLQQAANYHLCAEDSTLLWSALRSSGGRHLPFALILRREM